MFTLRQLLFCYVIMPLCHKSLIQMTILNGISWCTTAGSHVMFTIMLLSLSTLKFQHWAIRTSRSISYSLGDTLLAQAAGFFSDPHRSFFTFLKCSRAINEMGFRLDSRLPITFPVLQHVIFVSDNFLKCQQASLWTPLYFSDNSPTGLLSSSIILERGNSTGPLFETLDGSPVSRTQFASQLSLAISPWGLDPSRYKGHIFRIGAASHASDRGLSDAQIRLMGRWTSAHQVCLLYSITETLLLARAAIFPYLL